MTFSDEEVKQFYKGDREYSQLRRRYQNTEGKKKTFFIRSGWEKIKIRNRPLKEQALKLRGPTDVILRKKFQNILNGEALSFPFLSKIQNRILTMRALGKSHKQIARALSGGFYKRSHTAGSIRGLIYRAYRKIRKNGMEVKNERHQIEIHKRTSSDEGYSGAA